MITDRLETNHSNNQTQVIVTFQIRINESFCQDEEEQSAVEPEKPELEASKIAAEEQSSDSDYAEDQRMQLMAHMKAVRKRGGHVHG